jgi:E3 ubiquitin-protein ligase SHPRH
MSVSIVPTDLLVRLRQACSHPGVGTWRTGAKEMRTMDEVLEKMYQDTSTAISRDERELFSSRIKRGQIYDYNNDHRTAIDLWQHVLDEVLLRVATKEKEVSSLKASSFEPVSDVSDSSEDEDIEDDQQTKKLAQLRTKRGNELRDLWDIQHRTTFLMASAYFQIKNETEETRLYDEAEKLRRDVSVPNTFPDSC